MSEKNQNQEGKLEPVITLPPREPSQYRQIPIEEIQVGEHEQRLNEEDGGIEDLARSISRLGVLVPLHVAPVGDSFILVCGHRRLRASKKAGLEKVPCIILDSEKGKAAETSFAENFYRRNLSPVELSGALKDCLAQDVMDIAELAAGFHRTEHWVRRMIAICEWPSDILEAIHNDRISVSAAANIVCVTDDKYRSFLVANAVDQGATARTTSAWLQAWRSMQPAEEAVKTEPVPGQTIQIPAVPQAPCFCCTQGFPVNEMSHVPMCGPCIQIMQSASKGLS